MITESEFVMIRAFDKTLQRNTDHSQTIINQKNGALLRLQAVVRSRDNDIQALRVALAAERARNACLMAQIRRAV